MVPNRFHFVWYGRQFPFTHAIAIRSVARTCSPEAIDVHVSDDLTGQPVWDDLVRDVPVLRQRPLEVPSMLERAAMFGVDARAVLAVYERFLAERRFAALSDILRYLVLLCDGGVYLDLDVIVVRDLAPLRAGQGFCGRERILVTAAVYRRGNPLRYLRTGPLDLARLLCSKAAAGIQWWQSIEAAFPAAVNGAVLGLRPGHLLAVAALNAVPGRADDVERRRPAIGPDLLQELIDGEGRTDVDVLPPAAFYPLGPTMAAHYFAECDNVREKAALVVKPETYVVHWYNDGLRKLPRPPDAETIAALAERQLFSHLAAPYIRGGARS